MTIVAIIIAVFIGAAVYALLTAASKADDHAETIRNSEEEK